MRVSVIIPVYNAEKYLEIAVESVLNQDETAEIVLIEDGSPDNSLDVCKKIRKKDNRIRLVQHCDKRNHGAGASRNLGIKEARYEYIAFLDADDFYLPERFKLARKLFKKRQDIDGVYEAIGVHFQDKNAEMKWKKYGYNDITTISNYVPAEKLFLYMLSGNRGTFSLDGLVVKSKIFKRAGLFFENLRLHQDTAMTFQLAEFGKLYPGSIDRPVAMRRVHDANRFVAEYDKYKTRSLLWETLFRWGIQKKIDKEKLKKLFFLYEYSLFKMAQSKQISIHNKLSIGFKLLSHAIEHPKLAWHTITRSISMVASRIDSQGIHN